jgi:hypothetical protein
MTLTRLLEINTRLVKPIESPSLGLAERIWRECSSPTEVRALIDVLEKVLSECCRDGIRYAPILLQRKKALHRGTWTPSAEHIAPVISAMQAASGGDGCPRCGDTGVVMVRGGRGATLCPCEAWKKQLTRPA